MSSLQDRDDRELRRLRGGRRTRAGRHVRGEAAGPSNPEAMYRAGMAAGIRGDHDGACVWIARAIHASGPLPKYCAGLAQILTAQGKYSQAVACYEQAAAGAPRDAAIQLALAGALLANSQPRESAGVAARVLQVEPHSAEGWHLLGAALQQSGVLSDAATALRRAVEIAPTRAHASYDLGFTLAAMGNDREAEAAYRSALGVQPSFAEARNNLGNLLRRSGRVEEAVSCYRGALRARPEFVEARYNLGIALQLLDRLEEAEDCYRHVVTRRPDWAPAHNNLANTLESLGAARQSIPHYLKAAEIEPENAQYRVNLGMAQLLTGNYAEGWGNYTKRTVRRWTAAPPWDGSPLAGRRILLCAEQGFGDTIQFVRYARMLQSQGGRVWLTCPAPVAALLRDLTSIEGLSLEGAEPPPCDWQAPLLDLPRLLATEPATIPGDVPYLMAGAEAERRWRSELAGRPGLLHVGIAWRGSPQHRNDRKRSIEPRELSALGGIQNVRFVSLQKDDERGHEAAELNWVPLTRPLGDFADTAALVATLDLVISVDTAVAHLAGALGRPVWTLLPFAPDWRWMLQRDDTPWYPTMRLFRQKSRGDWNGPLGVVRERLAAWARNPESGGP